MRFLVDAQLPPGLAARLAELGHDARHVTRLGVRGVTDEAIWRYASEVGCTVISKDRDFADWAMAERRGPAVVWLRVGNVTLDRLWTALEPKLPAIIAAIESGEHLIEIR